MEENWDGIADWYAELVRGGSAMHRFSRDILLKALPVNVIGLDVLDVGCGEGIVSRAVGDYFAEGHWRSTHPHSVRRAGNYHRTISTYVTAVLEHGFVLRSLDEPAPSDEVRAEAPHRLGLPPFLVIGATLE